MAKSSKFAGSGRSGNTLGNVPKSTTQQYMPTTKGGDLQRRTGTAWAPGKTSVGTSEGMSTHNDIGAFQRGVKSRGPYGGPSFRSLSNSYSDLQRADGASSKFQTPTRAGMGKTVGSSSQSGGNYNNPMTENRMSPNASRHPDETNRPLSRGKGTGSGKLGR